MAWVLLTAFYGAAKGARELLKKYALTKNPVLEVLVAYTLLSFVLILPGSFIPALGADADVFALPVKYLPWVALKAFVVFLAWIFGFLAIDRMPVSLFGVLELSRVLYSTLLGVLFLNESVGLLQGLGLLLVLTGLFLLKSGPRRKAAAGTEPEGSAAEKVSGWLIVLAFASCLLNATSGTMDKVLMRYMSAGQLQFWYMLFMSVFYLLFALIRRVKVDWRLMIGNWYVPLLALLFVLADRALFMANGYPDSKVTVMTLLKQCGCVIIIVGGRVFFGEKGMGRKLLCAGIVIAGIVLAVL